MWFLPATTSIFSGFVKEGNNMSDLDQRDRLKEEPFTYKETKSGKILIHYQNKLVTRVSGKKAMRLSSELSTAGTLEAQLILAKATGNFKRGNERTPKRSEWCL